MDDHREDIQTEKLIPPWEWPDSREGIQVENPLPPWERPGCFRLDCEPHRGNLLWWLAFAGFFVGAFATYPCSAGLPGLLGIPVNLYLRHLARTDLAKMQTGRMDPSGQKVTASAESLCHGGLVCSVIGTVLWGGLTLFV